MKTILLNPDSGSSIYTVSRQASQLARQRQNKCFVRFVFNGVEFTATPKKSPVTIQWEYWVAGTRKGYFQSGPDKLDENRIFVFQGGASLFLKRKRKHLFGERLDITSVLSDLCVITGIPSYWDALPNMNEEDAGVLTSLVEQLENAEPSKQRKIHQQLTGKLLEIMLRPS